jgi:B-Raf proto-oncogene serine/threonine-protein kinase
MEFHNQTLIDMQLELENLKSVMQLTKENIDALNERFKKFNPPPKIYLDEYNDLTTKLHQLKMMEQNMIEKITTEHQEVIKLN